MDTDTQEKEQKVLEDAISEALAVSDMLKTKGWEIITKYYDARKDECLKYVLNRGELPTDPKARIIDLEVKIEFYNEICHLMSLPQAIINRAKDIQQMINDNAKAQEQSRLVKSDKDDMYI